MNDKNYQLDSMRAALRHIRGAIANMAEELEAIHDPLSVTLDRILAESYIIGKDLPEVKETCKS